MVEDEIADYDGCQSVSDVDSVTGQRIGALFGSVDDEFKMHREGILAMATLMWGPQTRSMSMIEAKKMVESLLEKNTAIEKIIQEGKKVKRDRGWL